MSIPYEAALRTYDTSIPVFVSDGMLSEDFQDKVLDFEFNAGHGEEAAEKQGL